MPIASYGLGNNLGRIAESPAGGAVRPFNTIPEIIDLLRVSRATVYRLISSGDLELVKLGAKSLITGRSLERVIARLLGDASSPEREAVAIVDARAAPQRTEKVEASAET
jgi:excisionase family DNA binding protein